MKIREKLLMVSTFLGANLAAAAVAYQAGGCCLGQLASAQEASMVYGASCKTPDYGSHLACGGPHFLGSSGVEWEANTADRALTPLESTECSCGGNYSVFGEGSCLDG